MRILLCLFLSFGYAAYGQSSSPSRQQVSDARADALRARGTAALTAEYAREKAGDCPSAKSTAAINQCLSAEIPKTQKNYLAYIRSVGALMRLNLESTTSKDESPIDGARDLDAAEAAWAIYRDQQCKAAGFLYLGGTMRPGVEMSCTIEVTRSHMHELESLYAELWG